MAYTRLIHPQPSQTHRHYPFFTQGGGDLRWIGADKIEDNGLHWVGGMMLVLFTIFHIAFSHGAI